MIMRAHVLRSVLSVLVLHNVFLFYLRVLALRRVSLMTNDQAFLCMHTQLTLSIRFFQRGPNHKPLNPLHDENETQERMFLYALTWVDVGFNMKVSAAVFVLANAVSKGPTSLTTTES